MSWLLRGIQSAVFHYVSCAPCIQYGTHKKRRKQAKVDRKARMQLEKDQPGVYAHPEPTGTNPFWEEEIALGPGPPPRRCKKSNTSSQRGIVRAGTHSTVVSEGSSSVDVNDPSRMSQDTLDDENWNRKRYQREDEYLWGLDGPILGVRSAVSKGSSLTFSGLSKHVSSKESTDSYYTGRVPPVNDLHPPVVSLPSPHPTGNQWMLQPPPNARVMSGKERATRSRSGSGASSRIELNLQRQSSSRQSRHCLDSSTSPDMSRRNSYSNRVAMQRSEHPRTPQIRPISAASSRKNQRRDTAWSSRTDLWNSSAGDSSSDTITKPRNAEKLSPTMQEMGPTVPAKAVIATKRSQGPNLHVVQVRSSRQRLSTVISSGDARSSDRDIATTPENQFTSEDLKWSSSKSSDSMPYMMKKRTPLTTSDISSLNALQDLVPPNALLNSPFISAPLIEARIKLPPSNADEERKLRYTNDEDWVGSGFAVSREWGAHHVDVPVPFDSSGPPERDPKLRWSVDF